MGCALVLFVVHSFSLLLYSPFLSFPLLTSVYVPRRGFFSNFSLEMHHQKNKRPDRFHFQQFFFVRLESISTPGQPTSLSVRKNSICEPLKNIVIVNFLAYSLGCIVNRKEKLFEIQDSIFIKTNRKSKI